MTRDHDQIACTWADRSACVGCGLETELACRWEARVLVGFFLAYLPFMVTGWTGLVLVGLAGGWWWPLIAYGVFHALFFPLLEIRILCSHCPYYSEPGLVLHCLVNHGMLKIWRYRPGPMTRTENILLGAGFLFFGLWPIVIQAVNLVRPGGGPLGSASLYWRVALFVALATLASLLSFGYYLLTRHCPRCVNFSCFLNRAPRALVDEYLRNNPVMGREWGTMGPRPTDESQSG
jgi:hypothetical protein